MSNFVHFSKFVLQFYLFLFVSDTFSKELSIQTFVFIHHLLVMEAPLLKFQVQSPIL